MEDVAKNSSSFISMSDPGASFNSSSSGDALDICLGFADIASRQPSTVVASKSTEGLSSVVPPVPYSKAVRHNYLPSPDIQPKKKSLKNVYVGSFQAQEEGPAGRLFNFFISMAEGSGGAARKKQGTSWKIFALKAFHVWTFFLAIVVIADLFTSSFLNLFLEYYRSTVQYRDASTWRSVLDLFLTCSHVILLIFFSSGLLERGFWLLADCVGDEMFCIYRKTLCFESAGPGGDVEFFGQRFERAKIVWDLVAQWLIFFTLDVLPIGMAIASWAHEPLMKGIWVCDLVEYAVGSACFHIVVYYLWSTLMDFAQKFKMLWQVRFRMEHMMNLPTRQVLRSEFGLENDECEVDENKDERADYINACVCLENVLSTNFCQVSLVILATLGLTGSCFFIAESVGMQCAVVVSSLSFFAVVARFRYRPVQRLGTEFTKFLTLGDMDWDEKVWAPWFARNCGLSRLSCFLKSAFSLVGCVGLVVIGLSTTDKLTVVVGTFGICLSCVIICFSVCYPNELWKVMIFLVTSFSVFTLGCALLTCPRNFLQMFGLILVTQVGLSLRRSHRQPGILIAAFFLVLVVIIAVVTLLAATSENGHYFAKRPYDWCSDGADNCVDFQFPTFGDPTRSYNFCGISWPTGGTTGSYDTVSDRCNDTRLTVVDFAHMSQVPYYLPNEQEASDVLQHHFPGWTVKSFQNLNSESEDYLTFAHIVRGSTHVLALRGTASAMDTLQDLTFWMPAVLTDLAFKLGPHFVGTRRIAKVLKGIVGDTFKHSYEPLLNYAQEVMGDHPGEKIYVTGHSLGGGIATIVAAFLHVPAITFSAPGLYATSMMLDPPPKLEEVRTYTVNIVPMFDLVPQADVQAGTQLAIYCETPEDPVSCHGLANTMCNLMSSCGDGGGRPVRRGFTHKCGSCHPSRLAPFANLVDRCGVQDL